jgi:hypothetical protein
VCSPCSDKRDPRNKQGSSLPINDQRQAGSDADHLARKLNVRCCPSDGAAATLHTVDAHDLAAQMLAQAAIDGQSARTVHCDAEAEALRQALRELSRAEHIGVRTARLDTAVVVVRLDADLWNQDAATMRTKLTPPG